MTKKSKIIFNLSIKDLKELGIIKTKRKSRKKKYIKQLNNDNIKSDSSHMFGQPTFQNVSNLQTENLKIQNDINKLALENSTINNLDFVNNDSFSNRNNYFLYSLSDESKKYKQFADETLAQNNLYNNNSRNISKDNYRVMELDDDEDDNFTYDNEKDDDNNAGNDEGGGGNDNDFDNVELNNIYSNKIDTIKQETNPYESEVKSSMDETKTESEMKKKKQFNLCTYHK